MGLEDDILLLDPPLGSKTAIKVQYNQMRKIGGQAQVQPVQQGVLESPLPSQPHLQQSTSSNSSINHESYLNLYFCAHLSGSLPDQSEAKSRLQLWTNLPVVDSVHQSPVNPEETLWNAWDLIETIPTNHSDAERTSSKSFALFARLPISSKFLTKSSSNHPSLHHTFTFEYTYRILNKDGSITWLGQGDNNGEIEMYLPADGYDEILSDNQSKTEITVDMKLKRFKECLGLVEDEQAKVVGFEEVHEREILVLGIKPPQKGVELKKDICRLESHHEDLKGLVIERTKSTWHTSRVFSSTEEISDHFESSLIVLKFPSGGPYEIAVFLPLQTSTSSATLLRGSDRNAIAAKIESHGDLSETIPSVVIVMGKEHEVNELVRSALKTAAGVVSAAKEMEALTSQVFSESAETESGPLHPSNGLGLCTWEAIGPGNPTKLSKVLSILSSLEIRFGAGSIKSLLIDDGWAAIDRSNSENSRGRLMEWELEESLLDVQDSSIDLKSYQALPSPCLSQYITTIKSRFPLIRHVGVWLTLAGYWDGISERGSLASSFGPLESHVMKNPFGPSAQESKWSLPTMERLDVFWNQAFETLKRAGVDFVKVDGQAELELSSVSPEYREKTWQAMMRAANHHFGRDSVIHCMAMGTKGGWFNGSRGLRRTDSITMRATDDYFPNVPDSHRWHIANNIYNSLLLSNTSNVLPDFDMFSSSTQGDKMRYQWAQYHTALRSFSASHLWLSEALEMDRIRLEKEVEIRLVESDSLSSLEDREKSDAVVKGLLGSTKSSEGSIGVVQAGSGSGSVLDLFASRSLPLASNLFDDVLGFGSGRGLKFSSFNRISGSASLGIWNTRGGDCFDVLTIREVSDVFNSREVKHDLAVFSPISNSYAKVSAQEVSDSINRSRISSRPLLVTHLGKAGYSLIRLAPIFCFSTVLVAFVGLLDKYSGLSAVTSQLRQVKLQEIKKQSEVDPSPPVPAQGFHSYHYWILNTFFRLFDSILHYLPSFIASSPSFVKTRRHFSQKVFQVLSSIQPHSQSQPASQPQSQTDPVSQNGTQDSAADSSQPGQPEEVFVQATTKFAGTAGFILEGLSESQAQAIRCYLDGKEISRDQISVDELQDDRSGEAGGGTTASKRAVLVKVDMVEALQVTEKQSLRTEFVGVGGTLEVEKDAEHDWVLTVAFRNQ